MTDRERTVPRLSTGKKLGFTLFLLLAFFALLEAGLRVGGFERNAALESMRFTFPLDDFNANAEVPFLERDERLFWKPKPHVLGHNSRGVFGPEFAVPKPDGVFRIVCLGDSCTHFGPRPYPERLQSLLEERAPGRFEVINAGVVGYSSHQGRVRLEIDVSEWEPDLVTIYFGWNDHWLARGLPDREQPPRLSAGYRLHNVFNRLRMYQLLALAVRGVTTPTSHQLRVSLADYAENLQAMKGACDRLGAEAWFMTAPHALDLGIPRFLVSSGEVKNPSALIELHRRYNREVRRVAAETGATLIDLEREIDAMEKEDLFLRDHIHFSDAGRTLAAERLMQAMESGGLLPE
jgi:lysophospholipase L1-like esterase